MTYEYYYNELKQEILRLVNRFYGLRTSKDDLIQEGYILIFEIKDKLDEVQEFHSYFYKAFRNRLLKILIEEHKSGVWLETPYKYEGNLNNELLFNMCDTWLMEYEQKQRDYYKKWYQEHKEEMLEYQKKYYQEHREEKLEYYKKWANDNREKRLEYQKKWVANNKEKVAQSKKNCYEKNKEKNLEYQKKYYQEHKEEIKQKQKEYYKRRKEKLENAKKNSMLH